MKKTIHIFKALSEEIRLRIVILLLDGELCVCDLMEVLTLPQSTISRHLAYLKNAGWVDGERRGVWMYYQLAQNLSPLQNDLLTTLKNMATTPEIVKDKQTLKTFLGLKTHRQCN